MRCSRTASTEPKSLRIHSCMGGGARLPRKRAHRFLEIDDRAAHAALRSLDAVLYRSTYFLADAAHEWSSRIARFARRGHASPAARNARIARAIASSNASGA